MEMIDEFTTAVAFRMHTTPDFIMSRWRNYKLCVFPRHVAMFVLRDEGYSLKYIGKLFDRHHSTVINAVKNIHIKLRTTEIDKLISELTMDLTEILSRSKIKSYSVFDESDYQQDLTI